uniref:Uncharacterized protein n=1 Tax=Anguilla anguilla TaxID=7936 RepID=A0A0E9SEL4_ANGAN
MLDSKLNVEFFTNT